MKTIVKITLVLILSIALLSCEKPTRVKAYNNTIIEGIRNPNHYQIGDTVLVEISKHMDDKCVYYGDIYWKDTVQTEELIKYVHTIKMIID